MTLSSLRPLLFFHRTESTSRRSLTRFVEVTRIASSVTRVGSKSTTPRWISTHRNGRSPRFENQRKHVRTTVQSRVCPCIFFDVCTNVRRREFIPPSWSVNWQFYCFFAAFERGHSTNSTRLGVEIIGWYRTIMLLLSELYSIMGSSQETACFRFCIRFICQI